jgi:hypothetical protein
MTDKELLELSAKAADIELWHEDVFTKGLTQKISQSGILCWNPLADDGDALRLAVACGIEVGNAQQYLRGLAVYGGKEFWEIDPDLFAATRRAITRAAASIGKEMK